MKLISRRDFLRLSAGLFTGSCLVGCVPVQAPPVAPLPPPTATPLPAAVEVNLLDEVTTERARKMVAYVMEENNVPGIGLGVVREGQVVYAKGHGVRHMDQPDPVTTQTVFQLADFSHTFTALAALQLVEQGKLTLDTPVVEVLPYFQMNGPQYTAITLRHLLTETAGLPPTQESVPQIDWEDKQWADDDGALERYVRSLATVSVLREPGKAYAYCNMAYDIAGDMIAKASGEVFEEYVTRHIFQPLGLSLSTYTPDALDPTLRATGHFRERGQVVPCQLRTYARERAPSVGVFSNVTDLLRWMQVHLNRGELDGVRILQDATFDLLWAKDIDLNTSGGMGGEMTFRSPGWMVGTHIDTLSYLYWGSDHGWHAGMFLLPERQLGALMMSNQFSGASFSGPYAYTLMSVMVDLLM